MSKFPHAGSPSRSLSPAPAASKAKVEKYKVIEVLSSKYSGRKKVEDVQELSTGNRFVLKEGNLENNANAVYVSQFLRIIFSAEPIKVKIAGKEKTFYVPEVTIEDKKQKQEFLPGVGAGENDVNGKKIQGIVSIDSLKDAAEIGAVLQFFMLGDNIAHNIRIDDDRFSIFDFDNALMFGTSTTSKNGIFGDIVNKNEIAFNVNHMFDILAIRHGKSDKYNYIFEKGKNPSIPEVSEEAWGEFFSGLKAGLERVKRTIDADKINKIFDSLSGDSRKDDLKKLFLERYNNLGANIDFLSEVMAKNVVLKVGNIEIKIDQSIKQTFDSLHKGSEKELPEQGFVDSLLAVVNEKSKAYRPRSSTSSEPLPTPLSAAKSAASSKTVDLDEFIKIVSQRSSGRERVEAIKLLIDKHKGLSLDQLLKLTKILPSHYPEGEVEVVLKWIESTGQKVDFSFLTALAQKTYHGLAWRVFENNLDQMSPEVFLEECKNLGSKIGNGFPYIANKWVEKNANSQPLEDVLKIVKHCEARILLNGGKTRAEVALLNLMTKPESKSQLNAKNFSKILQFLTNIDAVVEALEIGKNISGLTSVGEKLDDLKKYDNQENCDRIKNEVISLCEQQVQREEQKRIAKPDFNSIKEAKEKKQGFFNIDEKSGFQASFSAAETEGGRACKNDLPKGENQEDEILLFNNIVIDEPAQYLQQKIQKMVEDNKANKAGTTAALYYFNPKKKNITVANLGDSRVYLALRNKESGQIATFLLTEDHNLELDRVREHIERQHGYIVKILGIDRVLGVLNLGGAIGDSNIKGKDTDDSCLLQTPDIATFSLDELVKHHHDFNSLVGSVENYEFSIINACDGLTNHKRDDNFDYKVVYNKNNDGSLNQSKEIKNIISREILNALSDVIIAADNKELAAYLVEDANTKVAGDNISVSVCTFDGAQLEQAQPGEGILGAIFDGHGGQEVSHNCAKYLANELVALKAVNKSKEPAEKANAADELSELRKFLNDDSGCNKNDKLVTTLEKLIDANKANPNPTSPYRGAGLKVEIARKGDKVTGLEIKEVFSPEPENARFYDSVAPDAKPISLDLEGCTIIAFDCAKSSESKKISTLFENPQAQGDAAKKIAQYFHQPDSIISFEIETKTGEVKTIFCNTSKNKTAIFAPEVVKSAVSSKDEMDVAQAQSTKWSSLSSILEKDEQKAIAIIQKDPSPSLHQPSAIKTQSSSHNR